MILTILPSRDRPVPKSSFRRGRPKFTWWRDRLSAGPHRPEGVLDSRRGYDSLAWRRSVRRRWRVADLAGLLLGHRFNGWVAIQHGHKLVPSGLYGVIRHPSYLGLLVNSLGWARASRSGSGYYSRCCSFRRSSRAFVPKSGCCVRSSAASTMCTAVVHGALFPDSFEEMGGEAHCLTGN
jgi:hypothetical protein